MKKATKILIVSSITIFLILFAISKCAQKKEASKQHFYFTSSGNMLIGGMASDKDKLDSFKEDLEQDKEYSDHMYAAIQYEKSGDFENAIREREKAIEVTKYLGDVWMARAGLATLYEKVGKYDLAIKQYDWIIPYQEEALVSATKKGYKLAIEQRTKLVNDLKKARKRVEQLKIESEGK